MMWIENRILKAWMQEEGLTPRQLAILMDCSVQNVYLKLKQKQVRSGWFMEAQEAVRRYKRTKVVPVGAGGQR